MNRIVVFLMTLVALVAGRTASAAPTNAAPAAAARALLTAYRATDAQPAGKKLHVVAWRSRERAFPADQRARLQGILEHIRKFYGDEMERNGFGRLTFPLDYDAAGHLVVHEAVGAGAYDDYTKQEGGGPIRKDCERVLRAAGLDPEQETFVIFTNLAQWDPVACTFTHHSPYMGTGTCRGGLAWQLDHPGLAVSNLTLKAPMIQDGEYGRISLGKHNSIFIGGIAHELGHALGLPHCIESAEEERTRGTALMGSGNRTYGDELRGEGRGSFLTLDSAIRLASHPLFTGSAKGLALHAEARYSGLSVTAARSEFTIAGTVTGSLPVYAMIAYLDPAGDQDYDARTAVAAPGADGRFAIPCRGLVAGRPATLRLVACLANGEVSQASYPYRVAASGEPDVEAMAIGFELQPFLSALATDVRDAAAVCETLPRGSRVRRIAATMLAGRAGRTPQVAASAVPGAVTNVPLSRLMPAEARVGWGRPCFDHLPRPNALLVAGGELFETGIYAHAPSRFRYDLTGGGWKRLAGTYGLPGEEGSVVFVLRADGKEVLRSRKVDSSRTRTFEVDLAGVRDLELIVEDAGDGNGNDWGLWLGAELQR